MGVFRAYDRHRGVESFGDYWTLHKGAWTVTCAVTTHPLGWEVIARVNGDLMRSQVCKTDDAILDTVEAWKAAWQAKGWS